MADYRPLLIRAISRLDSNTPAARQGVYARARAALVALLNGQDHPHASEEDFERERRALEDAIGKVEFGMISDFSSLFSLIDEETFDFRCLEREADRAEDLKADSLPSK
jgi:hypothetical protein